MVRLPITCRARASARPASTELFLYMGHGVHGRDSGSAHASQNMGKHEARKKFLRICLKKNWCVLSCNAPACMCNDNLWDQQTLLLHLCHAQICKHLWDAMADLSVAWVPDLLRRQRTQKADHICDCVCFDIHFGFSGTRRRASFAQAEECQRSCSAKACFNWIF